VTVDVLVPPPELHFVGGGDFQAMGAEFLRLFVGLGRLKSTDRVLDVGCGNGRMAVPLTGFLTATGSYEGFDIVPGGIDWCQAQVTSRFPNFHFTLADVFNQAYNRRGRGDAASFVFPYESNSFDFAIVTSVFTHLRPADLENYLAEVARVLKPGGRLFGTLFLVTDDNRSLVRAGRATLKFRESRHGFWYTNRFMPEAAVGYDESTILSLCQCFGLDVDRPLHYGQWSARTDFTSYQDILTATKTRSSPQRQPHHRPHPQRLWKALRATPLGRLLGIAWR
jgi:SAM-dependent methyltransferase